METILKIDSEQIIPDEKNVIDFLGNGDGIKLSDATDNILKITLRDLDGMLNPAGILKEISPEKFGEIFAGENENDGDCPIENIYFNSENLALFVVTIGNKVSNKIKQHFANSNYAEGYILDAVASCAADKTAQILENHFLDLLISSDKFGKDSALLRYSPGYCGWNITGQKKLFGELKPERIGITLNSSYLMQPIKSISGVMISGEKNIHFFENNFSFCTDCKTISCKERMKKLLN